MGYSVIVLFVLTMFIVVGFFKAWKNASTYGSYAWMGWRVQVRMIIGGPLIDLPKFLYKITFFNFSDYEMNQSTNSYVTTSVYDVLPDHKPEYDETWYLEPERVAFIKSHAKTCCPKRMRGTACIKCMNDFKDNDIIKDLPCDCIIHKDCFLEMKEKGLDRCPMCRHMMEYE
jgi:hypothetical protein